MREKLVLGIISVTLRSAFVLLLLAVIAWVWYLLFVKKRRTHAANEIDHRGINNDVKGNVNVNNTEPDLELGTTNHNENDNDHVVLEEFAEEEEEEGLDEESLEEEFKKIFNNLPGPPRFLFTIKEETEEDLESEDGKSKCYDLGSRKGSRSRSLSLSSLDSYKHLGFNNPLFESELINKFRSSPPPKFKFLRDAEEKWFRRLIQEAQIEVQVHSSSSSQILPHSDPVENASMEY